VLGFEMPFRILDLRGNPIGARLESISTAHPTLTNCCQGYDYIKSAANLNNKHEKSKPFKIPTPYHVNNYRKL